MRDVARCWKNILGARDDGLRMSTVSLRNRSVYMNREKRMRAPCEFGHEIHGAEGTLVTI